MASSASFSSFTSSCRSRPGRSRPPSRGLRILTSIGAHDSCRALALWCESQTSEHRWQLQFRTRHAEVVDEHAEEDKESADAVVPEAQIATGEAAIRTVFASEGPHASGLSAENLVAHLEQTSGFAKSAWPLGMIRRFADTLLAVAEGRRRSPSLEARWLNLLGFCLRPGFGAAKDPWRIGEARKIYVAGVAFPTAIQNRVEWLVLWQRAAGGFSSGQQRELAQRVMGELGLGMRPARRSAGGFRRREGGKPVRINPQLERESWRVLASLERLDAPTRVRAGDELLGRLRRDADKASLLWAIGRLGSRAPLYGPLSSVVPPADATRWIEHLVAFTRITADVAAAILQLGALTGDPLRDVEERVRSTARARLSGAGFVDEALRPLSEVVGTTTADANRVFGEPLPEGLRVDVEVQPRGS